jgi:hypothetical protein
MNLLSVHPPRPPENRRLTLKEKAKEIASNLIQRNCRPLSTQKKRAAGEPLS